MAVNKRGVAARRGRSERRTAPARGSKARSTARDIAKLRLEKRKAKKLTAAQRFAPRDRVFHLVDATAFVLTIDRKGFEHRGPSKDARTTCCDKPIAKVYGVAVSKDGFSATNADGSPFTARWCEGAR